MPDIVETITTYIEQHQLLPTSGEIIVAVSGGVDSLCLLNVLHQLCGAGKRYPELRLHAAHLNHRLRGEASAQDAAAVAKLVTAWGIPITLGEVDAPALARQEHRSLEDAARRARYRFLREVAQGRTIAVAHHADDQVETLLLHWLRGGGLAGMVGMLPRQGDIIRPLLAVTHAQTVAYCQQHQIVPLEDASNTDPRFLRNRIRHELLPLLESLNPGIRSTLLRNAEVMRVDLGWIEAQVDACWSTVVLEEQDESIKLRLDALLELPLSLQRHLLRRVTAQLCAGQSPLELRHYLLIERLCHGDAKSTINQAPAERMLDLPGRLHVIRHFNEIEFKRLPDMGASRIAGTQFIAPHEENAIAQLPIPGCLEVPETPWLASAELLPGELTQEVRLAISRGDWSKVWQLLPPVRFSVYIDADLIDASLQVRTKRPGDRIRPLGMTHEKKVQDVLVDKHIPRAERAHIPLFFSSSHCVWLAGVCLDDRVQLTTRTQRIVRLSIRPKMEVSMQGLDSLSPTAVSNEVDMHEDIAEILLTEEEIHAKIAELGQQITRDYVGKNLLLLGTLKGAVPFIGDLARAIKLPLEIDYMAISSYGNSTQSSGVVRILKDLEGPVDQKHVLIVEDIVDSGLTLHYLTDVLKQRKPLSLCICTLLDKQRERVRPVKLDYIGFQIPNRFVVGYGLDYAQRYRNLPYIGILKPSVYQEERPESQHKSPAE